MVNCFLLLLQETADRQGSPDLYSTIYRVIATKIG